LFWAYRFVENETNNIVAAIKYFILCVLCWSIRLQPAVGVEICNCWTIR
jgi:hypothetical protein